MSGLQTSGAAVAMRQGMRPGHMGETQAILEQVSALAANTAVHQEIVMHMCRRFILQVCPVLLWQSGHHIVSQEWSSKEVHCNRQVA